MSWHPIHSGSLRHLCCYQFLLYLEGWVDLHPIIAPCSYERPTNDIMAIKRRAYLLLTLSALWSESHTCIILERLVQEHLLISALLESTLLLARPIVDGRL